MQFGDFDPFLGEFPNISIMLIVLWPKYETLKVLRVWHLNYCSKTTDPQYKSVLSRNQ